MKGDGKEINFEFVFAALYKINRPSCLKRGCFKGNVGGHYPTEENGGNFKISFHLVQVSDASKQAIGLS